MINMQKPGATTSGYLLQMEERVGQLAQDLQRIRTGAGPMPEDLADAPLLDQWCFTPTSLSGLHGIGTGHPRLRDGPIWTTEVYAFHAGEGWARTLSRFYRLGTRSPRNFYHG